MTPRPFVLSVDSASRDEPPTRYFGTLNAAKAALAEYDEQWQRFAWIIEIREGEPNVVHVRDGVPSPASKSLCEMTHPGEPCPAKEPS